MSTVFLHIAKQLRPGVYRLPEPIVVPSEMNFWEERDWRLGGCTRADIGQPIRYRLHTVLIRNSHEWYGFDEPSHWHHPAFLRAQCDPADAAVTFAPSDLRTSDLLRFLQTAWRVCGPGRTRRRGKAEAAVVNRPAASSSPESAEEGGDVSC